MTLYGPDADRFPVKDEERWIAGSHTFICSDLMDESARVWEEIANEYPLLVYCDPPYDQTKARWFAKAAERQPYDYLALYERVLGLGLLHPTYVECGKNHRSEIVSIMRSAWNVYWEITYDGKTPAWLLYAGPGAPLFSTNHEKPDNMDTPGLVMAAYAAGGTVFDPMAGRGLTADHAERRGWRSINNELNPRRVSAALSRLSKRYGIKVDGPC